uniref:Uncharacterized protein n=1 Tax=Rhizophora mucronata TaxID=61149 RepID=A0A2P2IQL6_RHIMU
MPLVINETEASNYQYRNFWLLQFQILHFGQQAAYLKLEHNVIH